jgi:hypothetical protein
LLLLPDSGCRAVAGFVGRRSYYLLQMQTADSESLIPPSQFPLEK